MGKTTTRRGLAALLAAVLAAALLALGSAALAPQKAIADPAEGLGFSVSTTGAGSYDVKAYRLFSAEVDDTSNAASNATLNSVYASIVESFIDNPSNGAAQTYTAWKTANSITTNTDDDKLAYIAEMIDSSRSLDSAGGKATAASSFSTLLAKEMAAQTATSGPLQVSAGSTASFSGLTEGFYLFYAENEPPMWTPVGGNTTSGTIKDPVYLTAEKFVSNDNGENWGKIADAGNGQTVKFQVKGEAPNTVPTETFKYVLTDTLPTGLTPSASNVKVYASDGATKNDITSFFTPNVSGQVLTVTCDDLYSDSNSAMTDAITHIIFEYEATLNSNATMGTTYNENKAQISYTVGTSGYDSDPVSANVTSYQLELLKKDAANAQKSLSGAKFTLKTTVGGTEYYVQADGTLATASHEFETDSSGKIDVMHIDAGTYVLTETAAPDGYKLPTVVDTNITITPTLDTDEGSLEELDAEADNGAAVNADVASGKVTVTIENDPNSVLPVTGMTPDRLGTIVGILLVAAGVIAIVVRARRKARA